MPIRLRFLVPLLFVLATPAVAQVELPERVEPTEGSTDEQGGEPDEAWTPPPIKKAKKVERPPAGATKLEAPAPPPPPPRRPARLVVPERGEGEAEALWTAWSKAHAAKQREAAAASLKELAELRRELGADGFEVFSAGLGRASGAALEAGEEGVAVDLALAAVELAPEQTWAHFALARAYVVADASELGRFFREVGATFRAELRDPRARRALMANAAFALFTALVVAGAAVAFVLFLKGVRYFAHDFHHLFPRIVARWQTAGLAITLLALPVVFRLGVAPALLALLLAAACYLTAQERAAAAVLLLLLAAIPLASRVLVERTVFQGTRSETLLAIERGGPGALASARQLEGELGQAAGYAELAVLGRLHLRRGNLEEAIVMFKRALERRPRDPLALLLMGNAMFAKGDLEGAAAAYQEAAGTGVRQVALHRNAAWLYYFRALASPREREALELDKAHDALGKARELDPRIDARRPEEGEALLLNQTLACPLLPEDELTSVSGGAMQGERVQAQLSRMLLGSVRALPAAAGVAAVSLLMVGLGFLRGFFRTSRPCEKCGRAVCSRCDPELSAGSSMCHQCVNVYARKGVVPPALRVRKQIEAARFERRRAVYAYVLGLVCSGAGHLFSGATVRGVLYAFFFSLFGVALLGGDGLFRLPFREFPTALRLVPLGLALGLVYLLSLRGLHKRSME